jgi:hypothetical protein
LFIAPPFRPINTHIFIFCSWRVGGGARPGRQTLVSWAERICKLACTSASEASGNPQLSGVPFPCPVGWHSSSWL